jgi:anti-anti-sigma factor
VNDGAGSLSIRIEEPVDGSFVVAVAGELDLASAASLSQEVAGLPVRRGHVVVIDASGLSFVDSSGLNAIVVAARNVGTRDASLVVAGARAHIARLFDVVRLEDSVRLAPSVDAALADADAGIAEEGGR